MTLTWEGGAPPYTVWQTDDLNGAPWEVVAVTMANSATVVMEGPTGFFQIASGGEIRGQVTP